VQKWYGCFLLACQDLWGSDFARSRGRTKSWTFLFVFRHVSKGATCRFHTLILNMVVYTVHLLEFAYTFPFPIFSPLRGGVTHPKAIVLPTFRPGDSGAEHYTTSKHRIKLFVTYTAKKNNALPFAHRQENAHGKLTKNNLIIWSSGADGPSELVVSYLLKKHSLRKTHMHDESEDNEKISAGNMNFLFL